jgi:hypothetical protein
MKGWMEEAEHGRMEVEEAAGRIKLALKTRFLLIRP